MGRAPCCDKANVKRGPWSPEEDAKLKDFIHKHGTAGNWIALPAKAGLKRCGKSCRLRWLNYLRPNIKHGEFSDEEDRVICTLYATIGSRWSIIASQLPGRTDNDIKNYWNTKLKKKLIGTMTTIPPFHQYYPTRFPSQLSYVNSQFQLYPSCYNNTPNQPEQQHCLEASCSSLSIKQEVECQAHNACGVVKQQLGFDNIHEELITVDDILFQHQYNTWDLHRDELEMTGFYY